MKRPVTNWEKIFEKEIFGKGILSKICKKFMSLYAKYKKTTYVRTKTCMWMCITAFFIITKTWKQPICPSVGEGIYKLWYIQIVKYN